MALIPYLIKTFRGGVSDENDKGIAGSFKHGHSLDIHKRNDSLLASKRYLHPVLVRIGSTSNYLLRIKLRLVIIIS